MQGRYQPGSLLSQHGAVATWLGEDQQSGNQVVIKLLELRTLENWKQLELFEREVALLKHLQHPGLPRLLDHFQVQESSGMQLGLVIEKLPGSSLEQRLLSGWKPGIAEILPLAEQILEILAYLHNHAPPVIHRDLKPSNILLADDGRVWLIDFGSVQQLLEPEGGSTVVGTFGYMPPEQFCGQAVPASDLYGLGATLVHLLARKPPAEMVHTGTRLRFEPYLQNTGALHDWLSALLAPVASRFASAYLAKKALAELRQRLEREKSLDTDTSLPKLKRLGFETSGSGVSFSEPLRFSKGTAILLLCFLVAADLGALNLFLMVFQHSDLAFLSVVYGGGALLLLHAFVLSQLRRRRIELSDKQLICLNSWLGRESRHEIALDRIRAVSTSGAFGGWQLEVQAGRQRVLLAHLSKLEAQTLEQYLLAQVLKAGKDRD